MSGREDQREPCGVGVTRGIVAACNDEGGGADSADENVDKGSHWFYSVVDHEYVLIDH